MSYRVCVTGGYPINRPTAKYEAEAIVTVPGGRVVKRFIRENEHLPNGGRFASAEAKRAYVERQAREWIAKQERDAALA